MEEAIMPTLRQIIENTGSCTYVRVGTSSGQRWIVYDTAYNLCRREDIDWLLDRPIYSLYYVGAREAVKGGCCELKAGIAILVIGEEDGEI